MPGPRSAILQSFRREYFPLVLLGAALLAYALLAPMLRYGDASDYVLFTESLLYDRDLRYTPEDLARHLEGKPPFFDSPAGLHTQLGRGGQEYLGAHHSFYYSLAVLPFFAVFGYRGFFLFNALCVWLFVLWLYRHLRRWNAPVPAWAWALLAVGFSAAWSYVAWVHTEVFYMTLVGAFMFCWSRGRPLLAAAALGLVAAAQPILGLVALPFLALVWRERRSVRLLVAIAGVMAATAAPQVLFNLWAFGAPHPLLAGELVGARHFRWSNFVRSWIDPAAGVLWFYPALVAAGLEAPRTRRTVALLLAAVAVILASGVSVVWYSHQVGLRYGSYVFPLTVFLVEKVSFDRWRSLACWSFAVLVGTGLVLNPIGNSFTMDISGKLFLPYRLARRLPWYPEDGAVLWNRLQKLSGVVGADWVHGDGWLPGDREVKLLLTAARREPLVFELGPWAAEMGRAQHLTVRTESDRVHAFELVPGRANRVAVPLVSADLWPGGPDSGWCLLRLRAEAWTPQLVLPGSADSRRLGALLLRVAQGDLVLYERPPG
jgi:hypothetical protein